MFQGGQSGPEKTSRHLVRCTRSKKATKEKRPLRPLPLLPLLQRALPPNLHRIRDYGFLNRHSSLSLNYVRMLVYFYLGWCYIMAKRPVAEVAPKRPMCCTECGGELHLVMITDHVGRVLYAHPCRISIPDDAAACVTKPSLRIPNPPRTRSSFNVATKLEVLSYLTLRGV